MAGNLASLVVIRVDSCDVSDSICIWWWAVRGSVITGRDNIISNSDVGGAVMLWLISSQRK